MTVSRITRKQAITHKHSTFPFYSNSSLEVHLQAAATFKSAGQREVFAPPKSYAAQIDSYGRFGTIYLSHIPLKMEPKRLFRNVVTNYQSTLRNIPEERRYNSRVGRRVVV
jgi:hypothetical protein